MGKQLISYFKTKRKELLLLVGCISVFGILFFLYEIPQDVVIYGAVLSFVLMLLLGGYDFWIYHRKCSLLEETEKEIILTDEHLPVADDLVEECYQNMIELIAADKTESISKMDASRRDAVDYYTLWAHQIKTPIAAMRLLLQSEGEMDEKNRVLALELMKIEQYVEMVLQYLRLDSTTTDYNLQTYDLDSIVRAVIRKYAPMFIARRISLNYEELNATVLTDEKWLQFVIEQVLSNALKYTKEGFVHIYMEEGKTLVIEDSGIGIKAEDLPRIFEKGYTGYNGRLDKKSTGIGLYLCKRIMTQLGHTIEAESTLAKGTRIKIHLYRRNITVE